MILHDSYLTQNGENIRISWDFTQYWVEIRYYDEIFRRFPVTHMSLSRLKNAFKENIPTSVKCDWLSPLQGEVFHSHFTLQISEMLSGEFIKQSTETERI